MTEPVSLKVEMLEADTEICAMHMLSQVMRHLADFESLTEPQRYRIAIWFSSRYGDNTEKGK